MGVGGTYLRNTGSRRRRGDGHRLGDGAEGWRRCLPEVSDESVELAELGGVGDLILGGITGT